MTRNLKTLGLTMVVVLAMVAVVATSAQAQSKFTSSAYPAAIDATSKQNIGNQEEYFVSLGQRIECEESHFTANLAAANAHLTVTPNYTDHIDGGNCRTAGLLVTTVTENGCTYTLKVTGTKEANINYNVGVEVVCPAGKTIVVHVRNIPDTADACTITVGAQSAVGDFIGKTNTNHINLSGTVEVKSMVHSNNTSICGIMAGTSKEVVTQYVVNQALTFTSAGNKLSLSD